ncbi:MAG: 50S ribosomal protein L4, partial [Deltaproteobacteria bacterium]|nr:50S ribosomal protein L4 [Deltaproteobacteria bacterium]
GTGRARAGTNRSPIWRGGGVVFGPKPRDYRIAVPAKMKNAAYRSLFSLKMKEGAVKIVEDFTLNGKTKEMAKIGDTLSVTKGVLITDSEDKMLKRAMKNIPWFNFNNMKRISGRDIFYSKELIITESALKYLNEKFA